MKLKLTYSHSLRNIQTLPTNPSSFWQSAISQILTNRIFTFHMQIHMVRKKKPTVVLVGMWKQKDVHVRKSDSYHPNPQFAEIKETTKTLTFVFQLNKGSQAKSATMQERNALFWKTTWNILHLRCTCGIQSRVFREHGVDPKPSSWFSAHHFDFMCICANFISPVYYLSFSRTDVLVYRAIIHLVGG